MILFIKGPPRSGKSALADRLIDHLRLEPIDWQVDPEALAVAQEWMGGWVRLDGDYFGRVRHLETDRLIALLQIDHWQELPAPPKWRPGADASEMLTWRKRVYGVIFGGGLRAALEARAIELIDSQEHAIVEGSLLGSTVADSELMLALRRRFAHRHILKALCHPPKGIGHDDDSSIVVNGETLTPDEFVASLTRRADGEITVSDTVGWTSRGARPPRPPVAQLKEAVQ